MNKHVLGLATTPLVVAGLAGAIASPVFAEGPEPRPCAELQDAINAAPDNVSVTISVTGDCAANITVPSNKNVLIDFNGGILGDEYSDTITVGEGAFVYLLNGNLTNSANGKAIIKNNGLTVVDASLTANDGAYSIINTSEVNIVETTATGFKVDNSGILRIGHGTIDNVSQAEPYVTGCINCERGGDDLLDFTIPDFIPVGFNINYAYRNPQYQATIGTKIGCEDSDVLEIAGSTLNGYKLSAKKAGEADVYGVNWLSGRGKMVHVYDVKSNIPGLVNDTLRSYLVNKFGMASGGANRLSQAVENGEEISVDLNIDELNAEDVNENDMAKIIEALGDGKVLAYGDISLAINASESGLIEEITDLERCASNAAGEVYCDDSSVNVKWSGLKLGKAAEGYKRNFYVIRIHDGKAKRISAEVDEDGNLVFPSSKFSTYVAMYEDVEMATDGTAGTPETGAATKSDNGKVIASLLGCMAAGIVMALTMFPKIRKYLENRKA